jgi:hypothetical protein
VELIKTLSERHAFTVDKINENLKSIEKEKKNKTKTKYEMLVHVIDNFLKYEEKNFLKTVAEIYKWSN